MLTEKKKKPAKKYGRDSNLSEIKPLGLQEEHIGHLDDDDILMQNVIGGLDQKDKQKVVESLLVDDQANQRTMLNPEKHLKVN